MKYYLLAAIVLAGCNYVKTDNGFAYEVDTLPQKVWIPNVKPVIIASAEPNQLLDSNHDIFTAVSETNEEDFRKLTASIPVKKSVSSVNTVKNIEVNTASKSKKGNNGIRIKEENIIPVNTETPTTKEEPQITTTVETAPQTSENNNEQKKEKKKKKFLIFGK